MVGAVDTGNAFGNIGEPPKGGRNGHSTRTCGRIGRAMYQAEYLYRMSDSTTIQGKIRMTGMTESHNLEPIVTEKQDMGNEQCRAHGMAATETGFFVFHNPWNGTFWDSWW